jgi:hypothetical protein
MKNISQLITEWNQKGCDYDTGLEIYLRYCPQNPNITKMLQRPGRTNHQLEKLKWQLEKLAQTHGAIVPPKVVPVKAVNIEEVISEVFSPKNRADLIIQETVGTVIPRDSLDQLQQKLHRLYNQRAKLSNALKIDNNDEKIIEANIQLLDQLEVIMTDMKAIEAEIRHRKMTNDTDDTRIREVVVSLAKGSENYTMEQLVAMDKLSRKAVRDKLAREISYLKNNIRRSPASKPERRLKNEKRVAIMEKELLLMQRLMLEI